MVSVPSQHLRTIGGHCQRMPARPCPPPVPGTVTDPAPPKLGSGEPFALNRATTMPATEPATTTLPSDWTATDRPIPAGPADDARTPPEAERCMRESAPPAVAAAKI